MKQRIVGVITKAVAACLLLMLTVCGAGCSDANRDSHQGTTSTLSKTSSSKQVPPEIQEKIEASLKADLQKLAGTNRVVTLKEFTVSIDDVGYAVDAIWASDAKTGLQYSPDLFGRYESVLKSRLRYGSDGVFKREIVDTETIMRKKE